jgi:hypothetical protein
MIVPEASCLLGLSVRSHKQNTRTTNTFLFSRFPAQCVGSPSPAHVMRPLPVRAPQGRWCGLSQPDFLTLPGPLSDIVASLPLPTLRSLVNFSLSLSLLPTTRREESFTAALVPPCSALSPSVIVVVSDPHRTPGASFVAALVPSRSALSCFPVAARAGFCLLSHVAHLVGSSS